MAQSKFFTGKLYARMADDLHLGGMSERTHAGYLRAVRQLAIDAILRCRASCRSACGHSAGATELVP